MTTKAAPIIIDLSDDFEDSEDLELGTHIHSIDTKTERDDAYYLELVENDNYSTMYKDEKEFLAEFVKCFENRIHNCCLETKDQHKYELIPKFTISKLNSFFEKPCTLTFDFSKDSQGLLSLKMVAMRSGYEIHRMENKYLTKNTINDLLDYLEHDFVSAYFLPIGHGCFTLGLARNLFGYAFSFLNPSMYEIKKTELGFDLIPYGKFKYLSRTIHFSFWTRTEEEKSRYVLVDSDESIRTQMGLPSDLNLELYIHRFNVEIKDAIRDKTIVDVATLFDLWSLEHYLDFLGTILPKYSPKLTIDQKNFLNALCKLYGEVRDIDTELRKKLELLIDKAFNQRDYTNEEKQMASQIYKQYRDWGYVWKSAE